MSNTKVDNYKVLDSIELYDFGINFFEILISINFGINLFEMYLIS